MPYTGPSDSNLPDRIKKLGEKLREAWVNTWNSVWTKHKNEARAFAEANSVVNKMKAEGSASFEIHGSYGEVKNLKELTGEDIVSYGLTPEFCQQRSNMKVIEGDMLLADTPFSPSVSKKVMGKESGIFSFRLPAEAVAKNLWQLQTMPIHVNSDFSNHKDEGDAYLSIGTILAGKVVKDGAQTWCRILGALWENDYPDQVEEISKRRAEMGLSVELRFSLEGLSMVDDSTADMEDFTYTGVAILEKNKAAFPQSQLLVAGKVNETANSKGGGNMKGLTQDSYSKEEVVVLLAEASGEQAGEVKHQEELAAKDTLIATEKARADKADADLAEANQKLEAKNKAEKETAAQAAAEKFWTEHEKEYPAENKDEIVGIRLKMELGTATSAESLKLAELKKTSSNLSAGTGDDKVEKNKEMDRQLGIRNASKTT